MPTNQQRREAAQRKLQRQLARRQERARERRQRLLVVGVVAAVLIVAGVVWIVTSTGGDDSADAGTDSTSQTSAAEPATPCSYPAEGTAAKEVTPPTNLSPLNTGTVDSSIVFNVGTVPVTLDRALAPCAVNSFLSLASQGFYDGTDCHRVTVSEALKIVQCGDPTGKGNGGPGYSFADEVTSTTSYPAGTLAMANSGPSTNGSQFFITYQDSTLDPSYTVLGTVAGDGLAVVQAIGAAGTANGAQEGPPAEPVRIEDVTVPDGSLEGTGSYETASSLPGDGFGTDPTAPPADLPSVTDPATGATAPAPTDGSAPSGPAASSSAAPSAPPSS